MLVRDSFTYNCVEDTINKLSKICEPVKIGDNLRVPIEKLFIDLTIEDEESCLAGFTRGFDFDGSTIKDLWFGYADALYQIHNSLIKENICVNCTVAINLGFIDNCGFYTVICLDKSLTYNDLKNLGDTFMRQYSIEP